jgi:hypothetical protein
MARTFFGGSWVMGPRFWCAGETKKELNEGCGRVGRWRGGNDLANLTLFLPPGPGRGGTAPNMTEACAGEKKTEGVSG